MSDDELMKLAAKAAGIEFESTQWSAGFVRPDGVFWKPLADDGDALRLAVKLDMSVKQDDPCAVIAGWSNLQRINITHSKQGPWYWKEWLRDHENYRTAATRRAIVRAAAEIGKAMP